jgi:hypothetical protein
VTWGNKEEAMLVLEHIAFPSRETITSGAKYPSPLQVLFVDELLMLTSFDFGGHDPFHASFGT